MGDDTQDRTKIRRYKILRTVGALRLECEVNEAIENGWIPWGNPFYDGDRGLCQAVVVYG